MISSRSNRRGFSLMETVIAIGVLAVLLSAFLAVFGPATAGIRRAMNVQEADRLASSVERELVNLRDGQTSSAIITGFDKAFTWIENSMNKSDTVLVYQYRGNPDQLRTDGTLEPYKQTNGTAGKDYILQSGVRLRSDTELEKDLEAVEGRVYAVKTNQLVFENGELVPSKQAKIEDPSPNNEPAGSTPPNGPGASGRYPEAVIAFSAEFYALPTNSYAYVKAGGRFDPEKLNSPVFVRNLAVRR